MNGERIYNTGRVRIGSNYLPPCRTDMDADARRLQEALLKSDDRLEGAWSAVVGLAIVVVLSVFLVL